MKQKINVSRFTICLSLLFLPIVTPQILSAQEDNDSTHIIRDDILKQPEGTLLQYATPDLFPPAKLNQTHSLYPSKQLNYYPPGFLRKGEIRLPYHTNPSLRFKGDFRTDGILKQFPHGTIFGSGSQTSVPGIGRFNNASLGYRHVFNNKFELQIQADVLKINMMHSTGQAFSNSGALLYHASDRVAFKVFGSYDIGNSYGMSTHNYGATMSIDMSDRFNLEMGVQRYYNAMRGHWETVPVVIPSYRFNNNFTLGLDAGGILYEILRGVIGGDDYRGNATIAPPRLSLPIRPR